MPEVRLKCRSCGTFNLNGDTTCEQCGHKLRTADRYFVRREEGARACPFCAEQIQAAAIVCKHCRRDIEPAIVKPKWVETSFRSEDTATGATTASSSWSPGVAAVLSFFIPGLGQIYKGQIGFGLICLIGTVIGYMLMIVPGLIVHLLCIVNAYSGEA